MARREPVQEYYSIGEVCDLTELKPHVLRYWESQFKVLSPAKNRSGNRVYARREVELILLVKQLLYVEKYTIDGARLKLDEHRRDGSLRRAARGALELESVALLARELEALQAMLAETLAAAPARPRAVPSDLPRSGSDADRPPADASGPPARPRLTSSSRR
jgi:DNA-binding transcriptional MerR regulator